ncbi:MAG: hypothetical protein MOB07_25155 [Acidobacteria bacterium]|nr:hypothetical protein [Acidobacteriota bacterium]
MKSRIKILSVISLLSLIFMVALNANAQGVSTTIELKKKGWVRAVHAVEKDTTIVEAYNLTIRDSIHNDLIESLRMNVDFQVPGRRVTAPEMVRILFDSNSRKRRFSDGRLLTIYSGGRKIELTATGDIWRREYEGYVFESVDFLIPYATFKELIKEKNVKMILDGEEFELPGWIRGELKTMVGMVEN